MMTPGPAVWRISSDLFFLKEAFGQAASFHSVTFSAQAGWSSSGTPTRRSTANTSRRSRQGTLPSGGGRSYWEGRDERLLPAEASSSTAPVLYRSAFESFDDSWKPPFRVFGKSAMAKPEVALAVAGSGLEPVAFGDELVRTLGISATSGLALEVKNIVFSQN